MAQVSVPNETVTTLAGCTLSSNGNTQVVVTGGSESIYCVEIEGPAKARWEMAANLDGTIIYSLSAYTTPEGVFHLLAATGEGQLFVFRGDAQPQQLADFAETSVLAVAGFVALDGVTHFTLAGTLDGGVHYISHTEDGRVERIQLDYFDKGITGMAGYVLPKDGEQHLLVATGVGNLYHYIIAGMQIRSRRVMSNFFEENFRLMTSYQTPEDGLIHVILVMDDTRLYHVTYDPSYEYQTYLGVREGICVSDPAQTQGLTVDTLTSFGKYSESIIISLTGMAVGDNQHLLALSGDGCLHRLLFQERPVNELLNHEVVARFAPLF